MAFIKERIPVEEWDLYNSFELIEKTSLSEGKKMIADKYSSWMVEKERQIYFIMTGVLGREGVEFYTLIWEENKIDVEAIFTRKFDDGKMIKGYRLNICVDKKLESKKQEFVSILKEVLQAEWENKLDFIEIEEIIYREVR